MSTRSYAHSGVDTGAADRALSRLLLEVAPTQAYGPPNEMGVGHFAAVIRVGPLRIALTTDGVGSKVLIAESVERYDTLGIDCVAMNVNDLLCVGATPLTMLDYIAVENADPEVFAQIGRGLAEGAKLAGVSIVGGETAQLPGLLRGSAPGRGLDLAGMALGIVPDGALVDGSAVEPGDTLIGLASNGVHANGLSLIRRVLLPKLDLGSHLEELGTSLGEELLRPTRIYVPEVRAVRDAGVSPRAIAHITGDGLLNLRRIEAAVGYELQDLPEPPAIFSLVERLGEVERGEMRTVFNMGIGMALTVSDADRERTLAAIRATGTHAWPIGRAVADPERRIRIPSEGLLSESKRFVPEG